MCAHCRRKVWYECWLLVECTRRRACHTLPCCALYYVTSILYYMSYSFYTRSLIYWCHILECHIPLILPIDCFCMLVYTMYNRFNGYLQCTVSYAPFYVCNERSAMTSIISTDDNQRWAGENTCNIHNKRRSGKLSIVCMEGPVISHVAYGKSNVYRLISPPWLLLISSEGDG